MMERLGHNQVFNCIQLHHEHLFVWGLVIRLLKPFTHMKKKEPSDLGLIDISIPWPRQYLIPYRHITCDLDVGKLEKKETDTKHVAFAQIMDPIGPDSAFPCHSLKRHVTKSSV